MRLECPVVVQEGKSRLRVDAVPNPDRAVVIDCVGKRVDPKGIDELVDRAELVPAGDADEIDRVTIKLVYLCDRRGFRDAGRSPGRPEPEHRVGPLE